MEKSRTLMLSERGMLSLNDVKEVASFDENGAILHTERGILNIEGSNIKISTLDVSEGNVEITGKIDSLVYSDDSLQKRKGLRARLFG